MKLTTNVLDDCVYCEKKTKYLKNTHIDFRENYIEGAGQLCDECYNKIYIKNKNMNIIVLGYKGMLGRYVYAYFKSKKHNVIGLGRNNIDVSSVNEKSLELIFSELNEGDVIINCIGAIKPMVDKYGTLNAIKINSLFPYILSDFCEKKKYKLIHITTDCVFSGNDGLYDEDALHDCTDVYGKTKSLGEPTNCTVMRTSIIGEEIDQHRSLIEWIKSMKDKTANGYTNHNWNGLTCLQVAKVFEDIIINNKYWLGVKHVISPNIVNKFQLLNVVSNTYDLNITVNGVEDKNSIDRTMTSKHDRIFEIPVIEGQILEMKEFNPKLKMII